MESKRWYLLFIPLFAVMGFVEIYPLIASFYISITNLNGVPVLSNYATMVSTTTFWNALNISLLYSLSSTIVAVAVGLGLTFILTQELRGKGVLEVLYILPLAVAPIIVGVLYSPSSVWDDIQGFLHFVLHQPYFNELNPSFYFPVMFFSEAWEWSPLIMLVALSIYNGTAKEIYEAAELHGASAFQRFRMVTLPTIFNSSVMQFIV